MKHEDRKDTKSEAKGLSRDAIAAAIEVHRPSGPGLLGSIHEDGPAHERTLRGIPFRRQVGIPLIDKGVRPQSCCRLDMVVKHLLVLALKAIEHLLPIHEVRLLTDGGLAGKWLGLRLSFRVTILQRGMRRAVNGFFVSSCLCVWEVP